MSARTPVIRPEIRGPWGVKVGCLGGGGALALLFGVCLLAGCMERRGASTTEGALEALREEAPPN